MPRLRDELEIEGGQRSTTLILVLQSRLGLVNLDSFLIYGLNISGLLKSITYVTEDGSNYYIKQEH